MDFLIETCRSLMESYDYQEFEMHQEDLEREYDCQKTANKELSQQGFSHFFECNPSCIFTHE